MLKTIYSYNPFKAASILRFVELRDYILEYILFVLLAHVLDLCFFPFLCHRLVDNDQAKTLG